MGPEEKTVSVTWWERVTDQGEEAHEVFKQFEEVSESQTLVLTRDFNLPNICWKGNSAGNKQSRRFLDGVYNSFAQVTGCTNQE